MTAIAPLVPGPVTRTVSAIPSPSKSPVAARTSPAKPPNTPAGVSGVGAAVYPSWAALGTKTLAVAGRQELGHHDVPVAIRVPDHHDRPARGDRHPAAGVGPAHVDRL